MNKSAKIYIAGHLGLIGSAVFRLFQSSGFENLIVRTHEELELTNASAVNDFFSIEKPDYVVLAAGRVGGIIENKTFPADFINTNLSIQLNVLQAAAKYEVSKLIFFASSCMYPRECPQPMAESALLSGHPEPTSMAYAISKLAGLTMCLAYNQQYGQQRFLPIIPNSVFGPHDNFDPQSGHVLSALIHRFHIAKMQKATSITLWGSGTPRREFIYADDVADAVLMLLSAEQTELSLPLNIGCGVDVSICELAEKIATVIGFQGEIIWDKDKPDGAPRKLLDSSRINALGWWPKTDLETGLQQTYRWYLQNVGDIER